MVSVSVTGAVRRFFVDKQMLLLYLFVKGMLMLKNIERLRNLVKNGCVTHTGRFHADDILSAALLKIVGIISDFSVIKRVERVPPEFNGLAFDIGEGEFDHHQSDVRVRVGGDKYAAFGLLWNAIGAEYIMEKYQTDLQTAMGVVEKFDSDFVKLMDLTDNFGQKKYPNTLSYLIAFMNDDKSKSADELFKDMVNYYCKPLEIAIYKSYKFTKDKERARQLASDVSDFIIVPLDFDIDRSAFEGTSVKYILKPSHRGTYNITTVEPYKIPDEYIRMPGCVQVYSIGAAFKDYECALQAAEKLRNDIQIKSM